MSGCCQGALARSHGVFPRFGGESVRGHVFEVVGLKLLRQSDALLRVAFDI